MTVIAGLLLTAIIMLGINLRIQGDQTRAPEERATMWTHIAFVLGATMFVGGLFYLLPWRSELLNAKSHAIVTRPNGSFRRDSGWVFYKSSETLTPIPKESSYTQVWVTSVFSQENNLLNVYPKVNWTSKTGVAKSQVEKMVQFALLMCAGKFREKELRETPDALRIAAMDYLETHSKGEYEILSLDIKVK